jgi:hypothetical protein
MATEPERPIETLLRAAAKKRREEAGAPFELHPADRCLLQGEVARKFARPQPESRSFAALVALLWPRFAWGVGILAVLGLSVWLLLPLPRHAESEALLARNQPVSEAMPAKAKPAEVANAETPLPSPPAPASQLGVAPPALAKDTTVAQDERQTRDKLELAAAAQQADQKKTVQMQFATRSGTPALAPAGAGGGTYGARYGLASKPPPPAVVPASPGAPPAVAAAPPAASMALAEGSVKAADDRSDQTALQHKSLPMVASANRTAPTPSATSGLSGSAVDALKGAKSLAVTQKFVQTAPATTARALLDDKTPRAHTVLASFQLEQTGSQLRIVDGDGSVYRGYVQAADANQRERSAKAGAPAFAGAAKAPAEAPKQTTVFSLDSDRLASLSYSFRVAGTNRSLNQQVVFTGDLLTATNLAPLPLAVTNLNTRFALERYQSAPAKQGQLPLLNSRISGKLVIGTGKAVEINALPAGP